MKRADKITGKEQTNAHNLVNGGEFADIRHAPPGFFL